MRRWASVLLGGMGLLVLGIAVAQWWDRPFQEAEPPPPLIAPVSFENRFTLTARNPDRVFVLPRAHEDPWTAYDITCAATSPVPCELWPYRRENGFAFPDNYDTLNGLPTPYALRPGARVFVVWVSVTGWVTAQESQGTEEETQ